MRFLNYAHARTVGVLLRFLRTSLQAGRMPSLLGREVFRSRTPSLPARAFEDAVVFACDVERCLHSLDPMGQRLVAFCILEDRSEWEASRRFHHSQSDISRRLSQTLDLLHETFCRIGLLPPLQDVEEDQRASREQEKH